MFELLHSRDMHLHFT